jgi:hypothetical protein
MGTAHASAAWSTASSSIGTMATPCPSASKNSRSKHAGSGSSPRDTSPSKRRLSGGPGAISLDDGSRTHLLVTPYLITLPGDDKTKACATVTLDKVTTTDDFR